MAKIKRRYTLNGIQVWITGESEQEVSDNYADLKYALFTGKKLPKTKNNFTTYYKNNWQYIVQTVSSNTARDYQGYMERSILPHFGQMNLEDISWRDIQDFYNKHQHLAQSTVHKWKIVLSRLLQIAIGDGIISNDPTKDDRLTRTKRKQARAVPSIKEYKEFLAKIPTLALQHERLYMALVGYTGLRKGEILGLKWSDISFEDNLISVERSLDTERSTKSVVGKLKSPKSNAGVRTVPLVEPLKQILLNDRHQHEFIITDPRNGTPIHNHSTFMTTWNSIKRQIDLGPYTSHSYRHAMCTTLLASGVDIKTAQSIIGHSQPSTTLNIYAHAVPDNVRKAGLIFTEKMAM